MNMIPLIACRVTKGSSDGTILTKDIIWLSINDDLNNGTAHGWLNRDEWCDSATSDFEIEIAPEYQVNITGFREVLKNEPNR